jgi:drug/metabolite transporter (DMT)-like permease
LIAGAILLGVVRTRHVPIPLSGESRILYLSLIFLTFTLPYALVYWAEQYLASGLTSVLFAAFPFWVALFSQVILPDQRLTAYKIAGILIGFAGIVVIFAHDIRLTDESGIMAMIALILSTVLQAFSTVLVSKYGRPVSPFAMNVVGMSGAGVLLTLFGLATESTSSIIWDFASIGSILYLSLFGSVVAFVTYHWLL